MGLPYIGNNSRMKGDNAIHDALSKNKKTKTTGNYKNAQVIVKSLFDISKYFCKC